VISVERRDPAAALGALVGALLVGLLLSGAAFGHGSTRAAPAPGAIAPSTGPLEVGIRADPLHGTVPLTIEFTAVAGGGSGNYTAFAWTFGDGDRGLGSPVNYTFLRAGAFTVTLEVTDSNGTTATATIGVAIDPRATAAESNSPSPMGPITLAAGTFVGVLAGLVVWRGGAAPTAGAGSAPGPRLPAPSDPARVGPAAPVGPPPAPRSEGENGRRTGQGRGGRSSAPSAESVRLSYRLISQLATAPRLVPNDVAPAGRTQSDLVEKLRASQSSVSELLARLTSAGVVSAETRHVAGRSRRVKVYRLTARGERLAHDLVPALRATPKLPGLLPPAPTAVDPSDGAPDERGVPGGS
jgi:DNA-binding transcriptional ArsR family regulator